MYLYIIQIIKHLMKVDINMCGEIIIKIDLKKLMIFYFIFTIIWIYIVKF
jgi:hypothetical protein